MNKTVALFAIALLSLSFVIANDDIFYGNVASDQQIADVFIPKPVESSVTISLVSPVDGDSFLTASDSATISFLFDFKSDFAKEVIPTISVNANDVLLTTLDVASVVPADVLLADDSLKCSIVVRTNDLDAKKIETILDYVSLTGKASSSLLIGDYKWFVSCTNDYGNWNSAEAIFSIEAEPVIIIIPPTNTGNTGTTTTPSLSSNEEGSGRRNPSNSPVIPLSNSAGSNPNTNTLESDASSDQSAGITGAVIGALGKKGALSMGVFITLVGVIALAVYNRTKLGLVKA